MQSQSSRQELVGGALADVLELEQDSEARLGSEQSFSTAGMPSECPEHSTSCSPRAGPTARGLCWRHHVMPKAILSVCGTQYHA